MRAGLLFCLIASLPAGDARGEGKASVPSPSSVPEAAAIPVPEIAARAAEVKALLHAIESSGAASPAIESIEKELPSLREMVRAHSAATLRARDEGANLGALEDLAATWSGIGVELDRWKKTLTQRATELERDLDRLAALKATWKKTLESAEVSGAPDAVLKRVRKTLDTVASLSKQIRQRRAKILPLQDEVIAERANAREMLAEIQRSRDQIVRQLLVPDRPPIWGLAPQIDPAEALEHTSQRLRTNLEALRVYLQGHLSNVLLHGLLIAVLVALTRRAGRRVRQWAEQEADLATAAQVLSVPTSTGVLLGLLFTPWLYSDSPTLLRDLVGLFALVPAIRILRRCVQASLVPALYALGVFYVVDRTRAFVAAAPLLEQLLFLAEMTAALAVTAHLLRSQRLADIERETKTATLRLGRLAVQTALIIFGLSLAAGLLGYGRLSELLGGGMLQSGYLGLVLYAAVRTSDGLLAYALRSRPLQVLRFVRGNRRLIRRRLRAATRWAALAGWIFGTLHFFAVLSPAIDAASAVLGARFSRGSASISLGDVTAFALTIWLAFLVSRFARFVLEEDVYPRMRVAAGIPYAVSSLLHYAVLLAGFFLAIAAVGFELNQLAFLLGAFGVGIGFGLQTVVNNFVSGLILLFERPIQVGDVVQIGDLTGVIKRIGIRASTLRTWSGAEVIVPNGNLLAEQVTNWTLSDRMRRIEIPVGVAYGTDPVKVLDLLKKVAADSARVLSEPPPQALFLGFGDSSLNFELRAWTLEYDQWMAAFSELMVGIYTALQEAGIEIPFPQRDLHLRSVDEKAQRALAGVPAGRQPGQPERGEEWNRG